MNYEETHTTVYKFRSMDRRKNNGGLREPLYPPPPGSPDFDPAFIDKDLVDMKREKTQYLPPYRYSSDEKVRNVYRSSDEAYCTVAKNLLLHFECGKNIHDAHEIVKTNLTPTQRKFFADAHMEKAMHIPAQLVEGEPNHFAIVRRCDLVFGVVLLEYYASSDGNLFAAQIESIDRALAKLNNAIPYMGEEQKGQENLDDRHVDIHEEEQNELDVKDSNEISDSSGENIAEESRPEKLSQEINTYSEDSTFDKIYHEGTNSNVDEESSAKGEDATVKTASTETHLKHSMLRQELLKEITQISQLLWSTNDKDQKELYEDYLDTLRQRFNDYADKKATDGYVMKTTLQSLQNNNRVNTDDQTPIPSKQGIPESSYMANISLNSQIVDDVDEHFIRVSTVDQFPITVVDRTPDKDNLIATEVSYKVPDIQHAEGTNDVYERGLKHQSSKLRRVSELESGLKNIQLVAPIAMKEGFTFIAKYRKKKFLARIPRGGVKKNQTFVTPMLKPTSTSRQFVCYETQLESMNIPKGRWRDGLFNCLKDPLLLLALFFPLGKNTMRLNFNFHEYYCFLMIEISQLYYLRLAPELNSSRLGM